MRTALRVSTIGSRGEFYWKTFNSRHGRNLEDSNDFGPCMSGMPDSVEPMQE